MAATVAFVLPLSAMRPVDPAQESVAVRSVKPAIASSGVVGPNSSFAGSPQIVSSSSPGAEAVSAKPVQDSEAIPSAQSIEAPPIPPPRPTDVHEGVGVGSGSGTGSASATSSGGRGMGRGIGIEDGDESKHGRRTLAATIPPANRQTGFECHQGKGSLDSYI
jgi:hypothetical protein